MLERGVQGKEKIVLKALKLKQKGEIGGNPQNTHKRKEEKKKKTKKKWSLVPSIGVYGYNS